VKKRRTILDAPGANQQVERFPDRDSTLTQPPKITRRGDRNRVAYQLRRKAA
jgi:hypothetical protein